MLEKVTNLFMVDIDGIDSMEAKWRNTKKVIKYNVPSDFVMEMQYVILTYVIPKLTAEH
ncbi:hypothetical protein ACEWET_02430 [Paraliobacillus sp. JSM ZJ581]